MGTSCQFKSQQNSNIPKTSSTVNVLLTDSRAHAIHLFVRSGVLPLNILYFKYSAILMHDISNIRTPSKFLNLSSVLTRSTLLTPHFLRQVIFMSRDLDSTSYYYLFLEVVSEFGTKFLLRYVNSAKTLSSVNYS